MPFAENLKYLMAFYNLSNYQMAKELGCHQSSVANWLDGTTVPYKKTKRLIAERFGLTVEELDAEGTPHIKGQNRLPDWPQKKKKPVGQEADGQGDAVIIHRGGRTTRRVLTDEQWKLIEGMFNLQNTGSEREDDEW